MRKYDDNYETFYLSEEERGIICRGLREIENSKYIKDDEIWNLIEDLITYLCELEEPEVMPI